jgi:hypothetical protein
MLAPVIAARLTDEMAWDPADFTLVAIMLAAACGFWELAMRKNRNLAFAGGALAAGSAALLLFLVNGAVGLAGTEDDPANLLFFGVLTAALGGAIVVRFKPEGMARTMAVTAGMQVVAGALAAGMAGDLRGFLLGTAMFLPLWLLSSWLFARAGRQESA